MSMELTSKQEENQAANYRKLWLKLRVDAPFMLQVTKMQTERKLPLAGGHEEVWVNYRNYLDSLRTSNDVYFKSDEYKKIAPITSSVFELNLPKEIEKPIITNLLYNVPTSKFIREIKELQARFDFEDFWLQSLAVYVITDKIYPPYEKKSKNCPPAHITEDWKIFTLTSQKKGQHEFLKEEGLTTKQIAELQDNTDKLPSKLIHSNLNIAQEVWGDWDDLSKDKAMANRVKKRYERFRKYFVDFTDEDMKILMSLNLPLPK